jgi:hypothetical protein
VPADAGSRDGEFFREIPLRIRGRLRNPRDTVRHSRNRFGREGVCHESIQGIHS